MSRLAGERAARLIERQMTMFHVRERSREEVERQAPAVAAVTEPVGPMPYVTISRQYGAHGSEVARAVAERLGWSLYDKELLEAISQNAHLQQRLLEPFDEHARNDMEHWLRGLLTDETVSEHHYTAALFRVLGSIAKVGRAVIVGRGAHLALEPAAGLRVRLFAPYLDRVRAVAAEEQLSEREARRRIDQVETQRQGWMERAYGERAKEKFHFDLAMNPASLSVDLCVEIVLMALRGKLGDKLDAPQA